MLGAWPPRCVYVDLDGTLLGRDGSLLHDADGAFSLLGVRALEACARAGAEVVLFSGRRQRERREPGPADRAAELHLRGGRGLVLDGEEEYLTGGLVPVDGRTIHDQIADTGAPALLLEHVRGPPRVPRPVAPGRDISHLFRGEVDAFEADALLAERGHGNLRLVDNGGDPAATDGHRGTEPARVSPGPARGVEGARRRAPQQARGYAPEDCIAIGDSREDLGAAEAVATFWLVANGLARDPTIAGALTPNARVCAEGFGAGVYEAVITELAERR